MQAGHLRQRTGREGSVGSLQSKYKGLVRLLWGTQAQAALLYAMACRKEPELSTSSLLCSAVSWEKQEPMALNRLEAAPTAQPCLPQGKLSDTGATLFVSGPVVVLSHWSRRCSEPSPDTNHVCYGPSGLFRTVGSSGSERVR